MTNVIGPLNPRLVCRALLAAAAAVLAYGGTAAAADLSVCIDSSSPLAEIDRHVAVAVAESEGTTLRIHQFDSGLGDLDDAFGMEDFSELADKNCALVLGFPIDVDASSLDLGNLQATVPYGRTGFVLVTPKDSEATTLEKLPKGTTVAVASLTTPNMYFVDYPHLVPRVSITTDDAFKQLVSHEVASPMLWRPSVVQYMAKQNLADRFAEHPLDLPHASFNIVALHDAGHATQAVAFEKVVAAMRSSGELKRLLTPSVDVVDPHPKLASSTVTTRATGKSSSACSKSKKPTSSAPPALYTASQATAGKQKYLDHCALCHGAELEGMAGPALKGKFFAPAKSNYHLGDIFGIVARNMPATQPNSLDHQTYVEIMAYLLQQNDYPAGRKELIFDEAISSKVLFISSTK